jgi:hypothetical protein
MNGGYLIGLSILVILGFLALRAKLLAAKVSRSIAAGDPVSGWKHALLAAESRLRKWRMESGPTAITGWKGEAKRIRSLFETIETLHPSVTGAQSNPSAVTAAWNTAISAGDRKSRAAATTLAEQYLAANHAES